MLTYITRRVLYSIPVLFISTFLCFAFVSLAGDPRQNLLANPKFSRVHYQLLAHQYHLDVSIPVRYWYWLQDVFTHKLGSSLLTSQPIWPDLTRVMGHTLQVIVLAELIALVLGVAVGIYSAIKQYSIGDYAFTGLSFLGISMPPFWFGLIAIEFIAIKPKEWFGMANTPFDFIGLHTPGHTGIFNGDYWQHLMLPVLTLTIQSIAEWSRYQRASMLDVMSLDYIRTATAKGVPRRSVIMKHGFRNALIPLVSVVAIDIGALFGGLIITEQIFSIPGMGKVFIDALNAGDAQVLEVWLLISAFFIILFNLFADLAYGLLDPRVRLT